MFPSPGYVVWMLGGLWADGDLSAASSLTIWEQISAACCCLSGHLHRRRSGVWWRGRGGVQSLDINIQKKSKSVKLATNPHQQPSLLGASPPPVLQWPPVLQPHMQLINQSSSPASRPSPASPPRHRDNTDTLLPLSNALFCLRHISAVIDTN